jgi:hypothetical protein
MFVGYIAEVRKLVEAQSLIFPEPRSSSAVLRPSASRRCSP